MLAGMGGSGSFRPGRPLAADQNQGAAWPSGVRHPPGPGRPLCRRHDQRRRAELDVALGGRLTNRQASSASIRARLAPARLLSIARPRPEGAIVVGLGDHADLGPGTLAETLRRGILAYAIEDLTIAAAGAGCPGTAGPRGSRRCWSARASVACPSPPRRGPVARHPRRPAAARRGRACGARDPSTWSRDRAIRAWHVLHRRVQPASSKSFELDASVGSRMAVSATSAGRATRLGGSRSRSDGPGRRRAGDALRDHHRPCPRRGVAGPGQHRLRRALRGPGQRRVRDVPPPAPRAPDARCSSCSGRSGSRRSAARTAISASCSTRGRRRFRGSSSTTGGPG